MVNIRAILALLGLVFGLALSVAPAHAATTTENWDNLNNWNGDTGSCQAINHTLSCAGEGYVVKHKTLVYNPAFTMSLQGWLKSPDLGTHTPSYFGAVLQSVADGNYYGSIAVGNWIDYRIFQPPQWIIFENEYNTANNPAWWVNYPGRPLSPYATAQQPFTLVWNPSNAQGTMGRWTTTIKNYQSKTVVVTGPFLPMLPSGVNPRLGFARGRAVVGPLVMSGTPL